MVYMANLKSVRTSEFYKYVFVGGINTVFGYGIFAFLLFLGLHYSVAVLIATILGILFNFQTYGKFVFLDRDQRLIAKFLFAYIAIYLVNVLLLSLMNLFLIDLYLGGAILMLPIAYLGYVLNKRFVWKK